MDGFRHSRRSLQAAGLGLLAVVVAMLPPLQLPQRGDLFLYDAWSRAFAPSPPGDVLIVEADDAAALERVFDTVRGVARLVVTTLPEPPSAAVAADVLGPTDVPAGSSHLRRTGWAHGGHLWFEADLDGVVRHDRARLDDPDITPSLAAFVHAKLGGTAAALEEPGERHAPRFSRPPAERRTAAALDVDPEIARGRIVIVGPTARTHDTPVGPASTAELVGDLVAAYRDGRQLTTGGWWTVAPWIVTGALLLLASLKPPMRRLIAAALSGAAVLALLGWATLAFGLGIWLPVASPAAWLLFTAALLKAEKPAVAHSRRRDSDLDAARRATADGRLADAWSHYRQVSPSSNLLPELYDLACALETRGYEDQAIDLFHRVAQIDGRFRDVAKRLVHRAFGDALITQPNDMPAEMGRYQLLEPIARGAMGYVYLGRDPKINRVVALKVINLAEEFDPSELPTASESFLREAEIAGRLSHPNVVTIYDVGENDGLAYIAMEFLKGRRLSEFGSPDRLLPVPTVLDLLSRTADALDYAHSQNVVHRDIKPANIMYDSVSDGLKITDFGIAKLIDASRTRTGVVLGTPAFMSPEQLEGRNVNGHTDLFALGVSLYQLLTGQLPFRGASMTKLMFVIANEPHESVTTVRPDLPRWLDPIVDRALAKDPADRYQSGAEMAAALRSGAAQLA